MIAIIGAGCAGLAAAWKLERLLPEERIVVFEKSRGPSGRAATRSLHGCRCDLGANFFKTSGAPEAARLILDELPVTDLIRIEGDVLPFDGSGKIGPGDPELNAEPKWNYRDGISTLGKLLAGGLRSEVRYQALVTGILRSGTGWGVELTGGETAGPFRAVILTAPAPQSGLLLLSAHPALARALQDVPYHRQFCHLFAFPGKLVRPAACHALINVDRSHPVAWLGFEEDKPGHVPEGMSVVVAQMQPEWSAERFDEAPENVAAESLREVDGLLGLGGRAPLWTETQRWRYAHPARALPVELARMAEAEHLHVAGDALVGKGRVQLALQTGLDAAARVAERLG